jgi:hypothetical protein
MPLSWFVTIFLKTEANNQAAAPAEKLVRFAHNWNVGFLEY